MAGYRCGCAGRENMCWVGLACFCMVRKPSVCIGFHIWSGFTGFTLEAPEGCYVGCISQPPPPPHQFKLCSCHRCLPYPWTPLPNLPPPPHTPRKERGQNNKQQFPHSIPKSPIFRLRASPIMSPKPGFGLRGLIATYLRLEPEIPKGTQAEGFVGRSLQEHEVLGSIG